MQIIQFKENQKRVWNKFIVENCSESFLQSWEWGEFQKNTGKKIYRIGVEDDNNIVAIAFLIKYNLPFKKSYLYCPRGPVIYKSKITNQESNIFNVLFDEIKKIAKEEKSLFLKIDPPIGINYKSEITNQKHFIDLKKSSLEIQPRNTLMLNLEKSKEELLKEMKQKTRYNIRLAEKKGVKITSYEPRIEDREIFKKYFKRFWKLIEETSARDKFKSHNKNYYWKMLESINKTQKNPGLQIRLYLAEYKNETVATNIVLYFGDLAVYLHGASSNKHRNIMAPYLLQWQQILDAKIIGCKFYDFWGVSATKVSTNVTSVTDNWGGITRFKKGFGGCEKNYLGAYDLVFNNIEYTIYKIMKNIKSHGLQNL